jgi:hypothetical protein
MGVGEEEGAKETRGDVGRKERLCDGTVSVGSAGKVSRKAQTTGDGERRQSRRAVPPSHDSWSSLPPLQAFTVRRGQINLAGHLPAAFSLPFLLIFITPTASFAKQHICAFPRSPSILQHSDTPPLRTDASPHSSCLLLPSTSPALRFRRDSTSTALG